MTLRLAACWILCAAVWVSGCGSNPYPGEAPGSLHIFLTQDIKSTDPAHAQDEISSICVLNIYDQLYEYEYLERPFKLRPCLASEMPTVSEDRLTYTIPMNRGITFVDDPCFPDGKGREVNAHDFVFCIKRLMDRRTASTGTWIFDGKIVGLDAFAEASADIAKNPHRDRYTVEEGYPEVEGLKALDDFTIQLKLKEPYPQLIWTLAQGYTSLYPREAVARYGRQFMRHPVGTGPYVVDEIQLTKKVVLSAREGYREERYPETGSEEDIAKGRLRNAGKLLPLNKRVVMTVFKETQPQWLYFMRGYLDRTTIPKDNFDGAVDLDTFELRPEMTDRGITLDKDPKMEVIYDCFNMEDPVVGAPAGEKGLAIRRAISLATANDWAIKHLYNGRAARVDGPILREFPEYDPNFANPWKKRPDETREQVLERARKILADAGMPGGKGIPVLKKDVLDNETNRTHFLAFQRDMADIGIRFESYTTTWSEFLKRLNNKKAQIWGVAWGADYPDPQNFFQLFYGPNAAPGVNKSCFQNDEFDQLYEETRTMLESPERARKYRRMQEIVTDECVWSFRFRRVNFNLIHPWLVGYRYNDMGQKFFKYCYVDDEQRTAAVRELNQPTLWPLWILLLLGVSGVVGMMIAARSRTPRW